MEKPRPYQIGKPSKVLVALAAGVVVIMLATMAVVNGIGADNFQRIFHKFCLAVQTGSMTYASRFKDFGKQPPSSLSSKDLTPHKTDILQPNGIDKQAPPAASKNKDLEMAEKIHPPPSGSSIPRQAPASSPGPAGSGSIISSPLPEGFGRLGIKPEISPDGEQKLATSLRAKSEIKPETPAEEKPPMEVSSPKVETVEGQKKLSPNEPGEIPASPPGPSGPAQVPSNFNKLIAQKGESLIRIVNRNYPENKKFGLAAIILANAEIANDDRVYPGQVLYLPEINFAKQTIRLKDNLFYAIYGYYMSAESLKEDTDWLAKKAVHFVVRDTKDSKGKVLHRVFLGGYETEAELEKALGVVKTKPR